ncbi:uncharacterized protein LOC136082278 [Hydra vulgaris]|uniref:Uncharacterized protein LOC136082278 n=1 Tax=Hydra vulgaris TaxID=6087 RepID=A0ABM4C633_HYDVU
MYSTEREILKQHIGWKNGWEDRCNFPFVKRIIRTDKISNNVISILMTVFKIRGDLFSFMSFLLPIDFDMPSNDEFDKMCLKLTRQKKKYKKNFKAIKNEEFLKCNCRKLHPKKKKSADADDFFTLNNSQELLNQIDQLTSENKTNMEQIEKFKIQVFKLEVEITDLNFKNRALNTYCNSLSSQLETMSIRLITELHQYINLFAIEFHACFPNESITRKMHELIFNVPLFVKFHKTIGLLSEEEGECLHNSVNKELRQLHSVKNQEQKLHLVLKRFELHSKADRKLQASKVRKCVVCSERGKNSFYRQGLCLVCGHQI